MRLTSVVALTLFAAAGSGSPGPNNTLLLASGVSSGLRATLPHVAGTAAGIGGLVVAVAIGVGAVFEAVPALQLALKVVGSAYLLLLAVRLATGSGVGARAGGRPLGFRQAVAFQLVNPKGWVFAVAVAATFVPTGPPVVGAVLVGAVVAAVGATTASAWALAGVALGGVAGGRRERTLMLALAGLTVASVVLLWV